ncbi:MAG: hypothetical protein HP494_05170 [Nitrospira sp.]|nr:hypothetical protein [Nitrospira sp.]MBH0194991.1 hypothetical protein [Nitrospira sp.]
MTFTRWLTQAGLWGGIGLCLVLQTTPAPAIPIDDDPNGFDGIPWGTLLSNQDRFVLIEEADHIRTYEPKEQPPRLGPTPVESMRFTTFQNRFGRVTVRYSSPLTHEAILTYLQSQYGPLDRTPGQIAVGPVKVYAWHGFHTDVTLRFESGLDRGVIFFEGRMLRERWPEESHSTVF